MPRPEFPRRGAWCVVTYDGVPRVGVIAEFPAIERKVDRVPNPDFDKSKAISKENATHVEKVTLIKHPNNAEIHLVDEKGETVDRIASAPVSAVRMAARAEIPAPRRPDLHPADNFEEQHERLTRLGYPHDMNDARRQRDEHHAALREAGRYDDEAAKKVEPPVADAATDATA